MVNEMWGLFLYSVVSGIGFDVSHSISDLNRSYLTKNACVEDAQSLNTVSYTHLTLPTKRIV